MGISGNFRVLVCYGTWLPLGVRNVTAAIGKSLDMKAFRETGQNGLHSGLMPSHGCRRLFGVIGLRWH